MGQLRVLKRGCSFKAKEVECGFGFARSTLPAAALAAVALTPLASGADLIDAVAAQALVRQEQCGRGTDPESDPLDPFLAVMRGAIPGLREGVLSAPLC